MIFKKIRLPRGACFLKLFFEKTPWGNFTIAFHLEGNIFWNINVSWSWKSLSLFGGGDVSQGSYHLVFSHDLYWISPSFWRFSLTGYTLPSSWRKFFHTSCSLHQGPMWSRTILICIYLFTSGSPKYNTFFCNQHTYIDFGYQYNF